MLVHSVSSFGLPVPNSQKRDQPVVKDEMVFKDEPIAKAMRREYGDVIRDLNIMDDPMKLSSTSSTDFYDVQGENAHALGGFHEGSVQCVADGRRPLDGTSQRFGMANTMVKAVELASTLVSWG